MSAPATQKPVKKAPPNPNIPAPQLKPTTSSDAGQQHATQAPDWYESYAPSAADAKATPTKTGDARHAGHAVPLNGAERTQSHRSVASAASIHPKARHPA
jgi:hypothetical protein